MLQGEGKFCTCCICKDNMPSVRNKHIDLWVIGLLLLDYTALNRLINLSITFHTAMCKYDRYCSIL